MKQVKEFNVYLGSMFAKGIFSFYKAGIYLYIYYVCCQDPLVMCSVINPGTPTNFFDDVGDIGVVQQCESDERGTTGRCGSVRVGH